jgi:hypothetical protein
MHALFYLNGGVVVCGKVALIVIIFTELIHMNLRYWWRRGILVLADLVEVEMSV